MFLLLPSITQAFIQRFRYLYHRTDSEAILWIIASGLIPPKRNDWIQKNRDTVLFSAIANRSDDSKYGQQFNKEKCDLEIIVDHQKCTEHGIVTYLNPGKCPVTDQTVPRSCISQVRIEPKNVEGTPIQAYLLYDARAKDWPQIGYITPAGKPYNIAR